MADEVDKLEKLKMAGVKSVFSEGDRVEFHSADDQLKLESAAARRTRTRFRPTHIGLGCRS